MTDKTFNNIFFIKKKKSFYVICYVTIAPEWVMANAKLEDALMIYLAASYASYSTL